MSLQEPRITFAIISHPDAGKTTITEKLLLYGGAIQLAGTVKGRKAARHATSDWMALEQQRGISITTSVMQFPYNGKMFNLLDTPGHEDFSEDTYRTLTAVDSALMVIDSAKGVEERTIKLMEVCRLRTTPILTFINKLDRDGQQPIDLLDEIERILRIRCSPMTWPIGMGKYFKGIYHLAKDEILLYNVSKGDKAHRAAVIHGLDNPALDEALGEQEASAIREEIELVRGASHVFEKEAFLRGELTPVYFGSAINNFGVQTLLDGFVEHAPGPQSRRAVVQTSEREISPMEEKVSGFVFKVQANMDPMHRDRIAFMRLVSGKFVQGMKLYSVRLGREVAISNALTFLAANREITQEAEAGDIIGLHNHGTIQIGDTFTQGENLRFIGIPHFAPELFRRVILKDPLKTKALQKGLLQLSEEGATQVFRPLRNNELILGAVGALQFDVVAYRLKEEYRVECAYDAIPVVLARWVRCDDPKRFAEFKQKAHDNLALDNAEQLTYLAPTRVNLALTQERWPEIIFSDTKEV